MLYILSIMTKPLVTTVIIDSEFQAHLYLCLNQYRLSASQGVKSFRLHLTDHAPEATKKWQDQQRELYAAGKLQLH